jgi:hypothetical protein
MSLTCYNYETEMSDFAGELALAISNVMRRVPGTLSPLHKRPDDNKMAIVHERRGKGYNWEHIAYGYYLRYDAPKSGRSVDFWIGKVIWPTPPNTSQQIDIGIWADGATSQMLKQYISQSRSWGAKTPELFWDLPGTVSRVPPYDDPPKQPCPVSPAGNGLSNVQILENFLDAFLQAIP